jgi:putative salt-induced outer membrane protein YdiY
MKILKCLLLTTLTFGLSVLNAATLSLTDGSSIKGELEKVHEGKFYFKTSFAGLLEIPQEQVAGLDSTDSVFLRTGEGEVFQGPVMAAEGGKVTVASTSGPVSADLTSIASAWQPGERDPIVVAKEAALEGQLRKWSYSASLDISGSDGNTENFGSMIALAATLAGPTDRLDLYANYSYKETNGERSQDEQKGGMRYTNFFSDKMGWFVREELERDTFELIDFRSTTAGGLAYKFVDDERLYIEGTSGISYRYESYRDNDPEDDIDPPEDDGFAGLDFGLNLNWQFADWGRLTSSFSYIPSLDDFGDFLFTHESGVNIPLDTADNWVLRIGLSHKYNSEPGDDLDSLDTTYFTRLILSWD